MIRVLDNVLEKQSIYFIYILCVWLVAAIGFLDYQTGYEISFFIFYGIPIWFAAWYANRRSGVVFAFICLACWFIADIFTGHQYSHPFIPYWNGTIRLVFFLFTAFALDDMKARLRLEELNADFDGLTGVLNGRGFRKRIAAIFPLIQRERQNYTLAFMDVDNFKHINDTKGHAEGDAILKEIAEVLKESLRGSDLVSRLGGDEFAIFLPRTGGGQSETVLTNLKDKLDSMARARKWPIGFSIGAGIFDSVDIPLEDALHTADSLMYEVKKHGKGQVVLKEQASGAA